ncbi:MAG: 3'-5' exonuclease [Chloroflexi bacterium]|nr:MAG: 3'-5' exonuclease [Chloroflexota bacterium]
MVGVNSPSIGWGEAPTWRPPDRRGRSPVTTWSLAERGLRLLSASFSPLARSKRRTTKVVWGTMEAMVQGDPRTAGSGPPDPAAPATPGSDGNGTASQGARRRRYGRRRGTVPVGECFVSRLGPANGEPFAAIDDPEETEVLARPGVDTLLEQLRFVSLDCETTGQSPHRLVELGGVTFTLTGHIASFETLVHCTDRINPYARRLHGITSASLAGAPPADAVLDRFRRFAAGAVLIEHSADAFDTRLIGRTSGEDFDADNIDTSRLAGKLWDLRDTIGLERLCAELGVTHRQPHHALADAEATAACFLELVVRGRERFGWRTLGDLLADGMPPVRPPAPTSSERRRRPRLPAAGTAVAVAVDGEDPAAPSRPRRRRGRRRRGRDGVIGNGNGIGNDHAPGNGGEVPPPPV